MVEENRNRAIKERGNFARLGEAKSDYLGKEVVDIRRF